MENREDSQKKMLLSILGVAILVVAVVGISFAVYTTTKTSEYNQVDTGTVMVSYLESSSSINIANALPISDTDGKALTGTGKVFNFTVTTQATNALTVPYTISLTPDTTNNTLPNGNVKVWLTENGNTITSFGSNAKLVSNLTAINSGTRSGSFELLSANDVFVAESEAAKVHNYTLRMWVDIGTDLSTINGGTSATYSATVNVDSQVTPIS